MLRAFSISLVLLASTGAASATTEMEAVEQARSCAAAGDFACSFEALISYAESEDWPLVDTQDFELLSGAMLEDSLIRASEGWDTQEVLGSSVRYLNVLLSQHPQSAHGYATARGLIALNCIELNDAACADEQIEILCANRSHFSSPIDAAFRDRLVNLLTQSCGEAQ